MVAELNFSMPFPDDRPAADASAPALLPTECTVVPVLTVARERGVTVEMAIDPDHVERFYELYLEAFGPLRTRAPARQVLHYDEFVQEMTDPRVLKYVAWNDAGEPTALSTLTSDLTTVPWISPEYFAARYPEHTARRAVYYWGFALSQPTRRSSFGFRQILVEIVAKMARERAVCAYDICGFNNAELRFASHVEAVASRFAEVKVEALDNQTYYGATFP
ncbi:MAG TPA: hypothetical protein VEQ66_02815 [Propionibacteriaceae bacterium]|nr:hypothetical protein [Propionibacteriaceae bacterium]